MDKIQLLETKIQELENEHSLNVKQINNLVKTIYIITYNLNNLMDTVGGEPNIYQQKIINNIFNSIKLVMEHKDIEEFCHINDIIDGYILCKELSSEDKEQISYTEYEVYSSKASEVSDEIIGMLNNIFQNLSENDDQNDTSE